MHIIINEQAWEIHESADAELDVFADKATRQISIRAGLHPECRLEAIVEGVVEASTGEWMSGMKVGALAHEIAQTLFQRFLYRSEREE